MNILVLDIGTTSMRGILYDQTGKTLCIEEFLTPLVKYETYIEQDPDLLTNGITQITKNIADKFEIGAISLTAFRSAPTLVDEEGKPLTNFIMWQDTRTREICNGLADSNEKVYKTTGSKINNVFTGSKLTWWNQNKPELVEKAYKMMVVPDYLVHFMTGEFVTDYTYGSRTSLMDIKTLSWDDDMCALYGVDKRLLCRLVGQGEICGRIREEFSKLTGVAVGVPVVSAGGDQQCGALGLGELDASSLVINCGTGAYITALCDEPYLENVNTVCNVAAVPGKYVIESSLLTSAAALNWVIKEFFPELWKDNNGDFKKFNEIAAAVPPLSNGLYCVPHFQGCGPRDWNAAARATFSGFSLNSGRADMARAIYEGLVAEIVKSIRSLPESVQKVDEIFIGGGLTKSDLFNQILADMTGKTLHRYSDAQATAIGAFASTSVAVGTFASLKDALASARKNSETYTYTPNADLYDAYQAYIARTEEMYHNLY